MRCAGRTYGILHLSLPFICRQATVPARCFCHLQPHLLPLPPAVLAIPPPPTTCGPAGRFTWLQPLPSYVWHAVPFVGGPRLPADKRAAQRWLFPSGPQQTSYVMQRQRPAPCQHAKDLPRRHAFVPRHGRELRGLDRTRCCRRAPDFWNALLAGERYHRPPTCNTNLLSLSPHQFLTHFWCATVNRAVFPILPVDPKRGPSERCIATVLDSLPLLYRRIVHSPFYHAMPIYSPPKPTRCLQRPTISPASERHVCLRLQPVPAVYTDIFHRQRCRMCGRLTRRARSKHAVNNGCRCRGAFPTSALTGAHFKHHHSTPAPQQPRWTAFAVVAVRRGLPRLPTSTFT